MAMFLGISKNFWGLLVCFFMDWKIASKKVQKRASDSPILHFCEGNKENEIRTKMEQEQWLQLKMLFLLGYNLKIVI